MQPSFRARDANTNTLLLSADQPLLGLLRIHSEAGARERAAEASDAQLDAAQSSLREGIRVGYLRYFGAKAQEEIARASVAELEEQVRLAEAKLKAGVYTDAEVLRVRVASANAQQQEIVARSQAEIARANLLARIGLAPDDRAIELAEPTTLLDAMKDPLPEVSDARKKASAQRSELLAAERQSESASLEERARLYGLLPDIDAEAAYLRVDGQVFFPANSAYVGVRASWAVWEWGAGWRAAQAAREQAEAASLDRDDLSAQVGVEVATAVSEARAALNAVSVAKQAINGAEEAYRETNAQVQAGTATTTDLLDAQAALTQAKLNLSRAQYQEAIARVSLAHAMGQL
jgi:outer membrane protein TolC